MARLLHVGQLAGATIGDARFRYLDMLDDIRGRNIFRAYDAGNGQDLLFKIDPDLLGIEDHHLRAIELVPVELDFLPRLARLVGVFVWGGTLSKVAS